MSAIQDSGGARAARARSVTAILGPTNTGKTHLAIERMVAYASGIIGLPLRLLAREVYAKVCDKVGPEKVALVTGEEKIKPDGARFWVSTVEAMPRDLDVEFVAIDEVQLAADLERGHVFTDRILNRRGGIETLLLGADTMRPILEKLLPGVNVIGRPRLSQLTYAGHKKITRLSRRSAIVAFSAEDVYAIAELIRRQRGGAAVVLGALSPRTRNAQVELYQSGDVEFIVATDAIGMGLNLDVDHIAFAANRKFDGYQFRELNAAELGQIAGRAGRHVNDGSFGVTGRVAPFEDDLVQRLEGHEFPAHRVIQWRNSDLDYTTIDSLIETLNTVPTEDGLTRAPFGEDVLALDIAAKDPEIRDLVTDRSAVERLWEVAQVPDYRKIAPANHAELVTTLYRYLMRDGHIPDAWFADQVAFADRTDGDIDTLANRIAHVRTWTFVANRPDWLKDPDHWQAETQAIEDKLSDALHERLTARFVDRRTSVLTRRLRENADLDSDIGDTGEIVVEGHSVGHLHGFRFTPEQDGAGQDGKALRAAAMKVLAAEITRRAEALSNSGDDAFALTREGRITWRDADVATLAGSDQPLAPRAQIIADEQLTGAPRDQVQARLDAFVTSHIATTLKPLVEMSADATLEGTARGVAYQIVESFGVLPRGRVADQVRALDQDARATLRKHGVRFGAHHIFLPALIKPVPRMLAARLWALHAGKPDIAGLDKVPDLALSGRTTFELDPEIDADLYRMLGFGVAGRRAVRIDILERIADIIRAALAWKSNPAGDAPPQPKPEAAVDGSAFIVTGQMTSLAGCSGEDFAEILKYLGFRRDQRPAPVPDTAADASAEPTAETEAGADGAQPATTDAAAANGDAAVPEPTAPAPTEQPAVESATDVDAPAVDSAAPEAEAPQATETDTAAQAVADDGARTVETSVATSSEGAPTEPAMIEIWRPRGPKPRGPKPRSPRRDDQHGRKGEQRDGKPARGKGRPQRGERPGGAKQGGKPGRGPKRRDRQDDRPQRPAMRPEDSPFAALAQIRDDLTTREKGDS